MPEPETKSGSSAPFVGRRHELTRLQDGIGRVLEGQGCLFLLRGDPGIGKTRLAVEVAGLAKSQGFTVFWGRCWEGGGAPAFWPWVRILRDVAASPSWPRLREESARYGLAASLAELEPIVPELGAPGSTLSRHPSADSEQARFRLFDAVTRILKRFAETTPLVLVLDDLHDGDLASVLLLRFLAREIRESRLLLVATYRDLEARLSPELAPVFGQLVREGELLHLNGLSSAEVESFIGQSTAVALPRSLRLEVHRATEGNPFYVDEVARVLAARALGPGSTMPTTVQIPDTVRSAIRERLQPLTAGTREALAVAALLGREIDLALLEPMLASSLSARAAVEEGVHLGILGGTDRLDRYSFLHELIRDTIQEDLAPALRAALHRHIGEQLEQRAEAGGEVPLARLAFHFVRSLPEGSREKALHYATAAGDEALRLLSYEDAVRHYRQAEEIVAAGTPDPIELGELLLKLGDAQRWGSDLLTSRATFQRVATLARRLLRGEHAATAQAHLARAALGYARVSETGRVDYDLLSLLEEALAELGNTDPALRSRLLARLAIGLYFSPDRERRERYSREAIAIAERIQDLPALVNALVAEHFTIWGPDSLAERLRVANQVVLLSERLGESETELEARSWRFTDLLEAGDIDLARIEHARFASLAEHHRYPVYLWQARLQQGMLATIEGRFADAEALIQQAAAIGRRAELTNTQVFFVSQLLALRLQQERSAEVEAQVREVAERTPSMAIWRAGLVVALLQGGRLDTARDELKRLAAQRCAVVHRDGMWTTTLALLAQACVWLEDRDSAATLYELLLPYVARIGVSGSGVSCGGPMSLPLGRLALLLGESDAAERHLRRALEMTERLNARPMIAQTQYGLALALVDRAPSEARDLAARAADAARDLGIPGLERQARELLVEPTPHPALVPSPPNRIDAADENGPDNELRREGEYWSVRFQGQVLRMKDSKGLRYLYTLLAHPGTEVHVLELVDGGISPPPEAHRTATELSVHADLGDNGEILDARAMAAYRHRLRDLRDDLKEAGENQDLGRTQRLREEMDFLTQQLASATGLGGRQRRAGGHAEQARINVTKAIGAAIKKLRAEHPVLAHHLQTSIKTGAFCLYTPEPSAPVRWAL